MEVNDILDVEIIDYDHLGLGVAKVNNFPIFVPYALVGELVRVKITRVTKNIAESILLEVLRESDKRNKDVCPHFLECGGCSLMHMSYQEQLDFKKKSVENTLYRIGGIKTIVNDVVANPHPLHYRNKIIVPLGKNKDGHVISGFYEPKSHNIVESNECLIEHEDSQKIISLIKKMIEEEGLTIYNEETNSGLFRNIMLRVNKFNEFMVVFVVKKNQPVLVKMAMKLVQAFPNIKSIYACVNKEKTNVILKGEFVHLLLDKYLIEDINGLKFIVHPNAFLQVNHDQAEALYNKALSYIPTDKTKTIIDAYCGMGSITLNLALKAKEVYGIEIVKEAVDNANFNKDLNNLSNAHFICGKCENEIEKLTKLKDIDYIVFDPPRKGCDEKFLNTVINMNIKNIIYISCLPQTFARDAKYLIEHGYTLHEVTPFDLFSQSGHVENIGYFTKTIEKQVEL
ncbi:MAG: 23S rRNA (uracil(1939)-C(5))-methyltransferase RlmD [Acholeplasmatales bacterium]|nr:23S rRNA (uracil(1939)-C(5))-methyltransferase RlmD [Acholeplasmatales bacterium]